MDCQTDLLLTNVAGCCSKLQTLVLNNYYKPELIMKDAWFQLQGLITYANMQERMRMEA